MSCNLHDIKISYAQLDDMKDVFELVNDAAVRYFSFNQEQIEWNSHKVWFEEKIRSTKTKFYVARNEDDALVGYVRFDALEGSDKSYSVSFAVASPFRGMGLGGFLLHESMKMVGERVDIQQIIADVKDENSASKKIFLKAGFSQVIHMPHKDSLRFVLARKHDEVEL